MLFPHKALPMPSQNQEKRRLASQDGPVKRFRVSRACDQCRTAREKCDANQPTCLPCVENKRACTYTSTPKKRGLQPGYIRSLEMTLAYVFQQNPEMEVLAYNQLAQNNTMLLARGTKESNQLHKSWNKSRFCRDVTKALSGEQIGTGDDRPPSSDEDSEVDTEDASLLRMTADAQSYASVRLWEKQFSQTLTPIDFLEQRYKFHATRYGSAIIARRLCPEPAGPCAPSKTYSAAFRMLETH